MVVFEKKVKRPDGTGVKIPSIPVILGGKKSPSFGIGGKVNEKVSLKISVISRVFCILKGINF